jgi:membrane-bound lytic murein transglycosylase B
MPFIALAILGTSMYAAQQQRKAASQAQDQAAQQNSQAAAQMEKQIAAQRAQADVARATLDNSIAQSSQQKAKLEAEAKAASDSLDAERRKIGEAEAARLKSLRRSGSRSLLSDSRLNPELGLTNPSDTLGMGTSV